LKDDTRKKRTKRKIRVKREKEANTRQRGQHYRRGKWQGMRDKKVLKKKDGTIVRQRKPHF